MEARVWFVILCGFIGLLFSVIGFWRRKAGEAAFAAARKADTVGERDRYCRLAVMAGHRNACRMFALARSAFFEGRQPLRPFKSHGIRMVFYGFYYPSRYGDLLDGEQRAFCRNLYRFKDGEIHGIGFFKACMDALQTEGRSYHVMFMPCSDEGKYVRRFQRLDGYIGKRRPELTSGFHDVEIFGSRESLHKAKRGKKRILERNYRIMGNLAGKEVVIIDDVMTTGQSVADYKQEIERCGGKVAAAIFYGMTVTVPPLLLIRAHVWGGYLAGQIGKIAESVVREIGRQAQR